MPSYTAVGTFVPDVSLRAKLPQLALDRIRGDYGAVVGECFMVGLNEAQFVEVVDHEPGGLAHALGRSVAEKVQPLQASAVAEMEPGKRVERLAAAFRTQGVEGCKAEEDRAQPLSCGRVLVPVRSAKVFASTPSSPAVAGSSATRFSQGPKPGAGDSAT